MCMCAGYVYVHMHGPDLERHPLAEEHREAAARREPVDYEGEGGEDAPPSEVGRDVSQIVGLCGEVYAYVYACVCAYAYVGLCADCRKGSAVKSSSERVDRMHMAHITRTCTCVHTHMCMHARACIPAVKSSSER